MMDGHGGDYTLNPREQAALARFLKTGQRRRFVHEGRAHRRRTGASLRTTIATRLRTATRDQTETRRNLAHVRDRVVADGGRGDLAARHGLTFTRPFRDKRVFERALAIPKDPYLRDRRNRYLACRALARRS